MEQKIRSNIDKIIVKKTGVIAENADRFAINNSEQWAIFGQNCCSKNLITSSLGQPFFHMASSIKMLAANQLINILWKLGAIKAILLSLRIRRVNLLGRKVNDFSPNLALQVPCLSHELKHLPVLWMQGLGQKQIRWQGEGRTKGNRKLKVNGKNKQGDENHPVVPTKIVPPSRQ